MRCKTAQKWISRHADGELPEPQVRELEDHIAACHACAAESADLESLSRQLNLFSAPEPRWGFAERFAARLDAGSTPTSRSWFDRFRPVPIGLGLAAFLLGVLLTKSPARDMVEPPQLDEIAREYTDPLMEETIEAELIALFPNGGQN